MAVQTEGEVHHQKVANESVLNKFNPKRNTLNAASSMIMEENKRNTNS
jgi:hypothetical protein